MADVTVTDNPAEGRFEAHLDDGTLAGIAEYRLAEGIIDFIHTEVLVEGRGIGSTLARAALDEVRARGDRQVVPHCKFIRGWIAKHPDYQDLLSDEGRVLVDKVLRSA